MSENFNPPILESLPPPSLPLSTSRFFDGREDSSASNSSVPFHSWVRHQQKKLFKLNRKRAANIKDIPKTSFQVPTAHLSNTNLLKSDVFKLLKTLINEWKTVESEENLKLEKLSGAMTNSMFICTATGIPPTEAPAKILLRVYGTGSDQFFDRQREIFILQVLSCMKVGPKLLAMFDNGRFEEFIESTSLRNTDLYAMDTSKAIAEKLFGIHSLVGIIPALSDEENGSGLFKKAYDSELWSRLEDWFQKAQAAVSKIKNCPEEVRSLDFEKLRQEIGHLKELIAKMESPVVFTHNDLQYGNILKREPDGDVLLIDFEYSCYNYRGFDIANHFCEWAADYHSSEPHKLDFSKYPTEQQANYFFNAYLDERDRFIQSRMNYRRSSFSSIPPISSDQARIVSSLNPQAPTTSYSVEHPFISPRLGPKVNWMVGPSPVLSPDQSPSLSPMLTPQMLKEFRKLELAHLKEEVDHFVLISHVMWALWGIIQAQQSVIDFDYIHYATQRLQQYDILKKSMLK